MVYPIIDVSSWRAIEVEQAGSKPKLWVIDDHDDRWLFKYPRDRTGEHWAEKVAASVAALLSVPHASVELASRDGAMGTIARDFTDNRRAGPLVLGNVLLPTVLPSYDPGQRRPRTHTVEAVLAFLALSRVFRPPSSIGHPSLRSAAQVFVGYLMLDALVGNTDRHHENWGVLLRPARGTQAELAPSFDHASSLGRELDDSQRELRLSGRDSNATVEQYCARGRSPLFEASDDASRPLTVRAVFERAAARHPDAARTWLGFLASVSDDQLATQVQEIPDPLISPAARRFATSMLCSNRQWLLRLIT